MTAPARPPMRPAMRVGLGFDVHRFDLDGERPLVLGGVVIPGGPGLVGHSDADVVAHAVADAVLGAAGLDDLGTRFPASDDRYRDASSLTLLAAALDQVHAAGWQVGNVDVAIAAEVPRLGPYTAAMIANLTETLAAPVSIKPKHAEGLGAIGRAEGIAAWAVALLVPLGDAAASEGEA